MVTMDDALAEKMRLMRNFGFQGYDNVVYPGTNGKLTEIAAAMGLTNLEELERVRRVLNHRNYVLLPNVRLTRCPGLSLLAFDESERNNFQYIVVEVKP